MKHAARPFLLALCLLVVACHSVWEKYPGRYLIHHAKKEYVMVDPEVDEAVPAIRSKEVPALKGSFEMYALPPE